MVALVLDGLVGFPAGLSPTSFHLFPKQFTVRGSQCFKEWSPWCWMVWSGSRPACLPLPFICLPVLFICLPGWVHVVRFPAGLSPIFICFPLLFMCLSLPFICPPLLFTCLPVLFICLPGWVLVVGFPAGLSPTSFNLSPTSFHVVRFPAGLSPTSFHLSPASFHLSPRLGACGPVPGWLVSHFLSFVSQARCLWSGSRLACLPLPCICLPFPFFVSDFFSFVPAGLSPTSLICLPFPFNCLPVLFICLPGWVLVVRFPAGLWSGSRLACLPLLFICLPGSALVVRFPAGLSPTSLICLPFPFNCLPVLFICLPHWMLVVGFPASLSPTSLHLSPTFSPSSLLLGVRNSFLRCCPPFVSLFFTGDATSTFICLPGLSLVVSALFRWPCRNSVHLSPRSVTAGVRPFPLAT